MNPFSKSKTKVKAEEQKETKNDMSALEELYYSEAQKSAKPSQIPLDKEAVEQEEDKGWLDEKYDGQLSVDVYQTGDEIVIKSTIAGVKAEDVDVSLNGDMITIRGVRGQEEEVDEDDYFYQECYWGGFSRSIILPVEVRSDKVQATMEDGILTIRLPKLKRAKSTTIKVKEKGNQ